MGRRGRPSNPGKRYPGGKRVAAVTHDKGSEWVQSQRAKFREHYNTALGRAYAAGLLGDDQDVAMDRYQGGKRFARVYNRVCGGETYRCPLDRTPRGSESKLEAIEYAELDRNWLFSAIEAMDVAGCRPWLDQLLARAHTDTGPDWLDRLLEVKLWNDALPNVNAKRRTQAKKGAQEYVPLQKRAADPRDEMILKAAINALDIVAPARKEIGILAERWDDAA